MFFLGESFPYLKDHLYRLQLSGEWLRIFHYSKGITLKTSHWHHLATQQKCPWKFGSSCSKHRGKLLQFSVILVTLLNKFTRITLHAFAQSTSSSTQSPGEEILWKRVSPQLFRCIAQKHAGIVSIENFPNRELGRKACTSRYLAISSIFHMNFMETNLQDLGSFLLFSEIFSAV